MPESCWGSPSPKSPLQSVLFWLSLPEPKAICPRLRFLSPQGLFKARKILSEDYGSIHVYFGQPVSVRSLAQGRVDRCQFSLVPRYQVQDQGNRPLIIRTPPLAAFTNHWTCVRLRHIPRRPGEDIQNFVNDSAYRLLRAQEDNMVLKPWVLLASLLLQDHHHKLTVGQRPGLRLDQLTAGAVWLRDMSRQYGAFLHWPGTAPNGPEGAQMGQNGPNSRVGTQAYHQNSYLSCSASSRPSASIRSGLC